MCPNHFQYGKPTDSYPHPTLFLKGYTDDGPSNLKRRRLDRSAAVDQTHTEMTTVDVGKNTENCKVAEVIDEETADCNFHVSASGDCVAPDQECTLQKLLSISEEHNSSRLSWESISGKNSIIKYIQAAQLPKYSCSLLIVSDQSIGKSDTSKAGTHSRLKAINLAHQRICQGKSPDHPGCLH